MFLPLSIEGCFFFLLFFKKKIHFAFRGSNILETLLTLQTFHFQITFSNHVPSIVPIRSNFSYPLFLFTSLTTEGRCVSVQNGPDINVKDILKTTVLLWRAQDTHRKVPTLLLWQTYAASARSTSPGAIRCCYRWMARRWGWGGGDTGRDETQNKRLQRHPMPNGENKKGRRGQTSERKGKGWGTEGQTEEFSFEVISVWSLRQQQDGRKRDTRE